MTITDGPIILSASVTPMPTTQKGTLSLSDRLSSPTQAAFVLDDLKRGTLISLAQLCEDDCIAIFTKYDVQTIDQVIIKGQRCPMDYGQFPSQKLLNLKQMQSFAPTSRSKTLQCIYMLLSAALPLQHLFELYAADT
jgi:hypothetical protein